MNKKSQVIGYVRVSSVTQNTDRQDLTMEGCDKVFTDKASGKSTDGRPQLMAMLEYVREGDVVKVHSLDRLGRNLEDLLSLVRKINDRGASVEFLKEKMLFEPNSNNPMQVMMFQVFGAVAQFERALILERQREGISIAKAEGRYANNGRKRIPAEKISEIDKLIEAGDSVSAACRKVGVGRTAYYSAKKG